MQDEYLDMYEITLHVDASKEANSWLKVQAQFHTDIPVSIMRLIQTESREICRLVGRGVPINSIFYRRGPNF